MNHCTILSKMQEWFSWQRCKAFAERIYANDRWFSNDRFQKTAEYCASVMREARLSQVELLGLKADGRSAYGDWVIARAWNAKNATLRLVDDGTVLADYQAAPCALALQSAPTPPEGVCAEAVWVQRAEEIPDVREKILFTGLPAKELVRAAQQGGALGIVTDYMPLFPGVRDNRESMRGVNRWDNDFCLPKNDTGLFAFSLAPEMGELLRNRLASEEKVRLFAQVDTEERDGMLPSISGCIPGSDPECGEIFVYGHLYEPGANDNASGCALILETANCLARAIAEGCLPRPRRTIRFAMGQECGGSTGYLLRHPERKARLAIVADMVGTESIDHARLSIWHNPLANWSFLDTAVLEILKACRAQFDPEFVWEERAFAVGTDNMLSDPCWNMPTVAMITEPALSYHSSMDTPDRLEESVMRRNAMVLGAFVWFCANFAQGEAEGLLPAMREQIERRAAGARTAAEKALWADARAHAERAMTAFCANAEAPGFAAKQTFAPAPDAAAAQIPVRNVPGCLTFAPHSALRHSQWQPAWNTRLNLPLFWANGTRSLWEIACLSAIEEGETDAAARLSWLREYFGVLAEYGYIHWRKPAQVEGKV